MLVAPSRIRVGIDRRTYRQISGWEHCAQSLQILLSTRIGTRVMQLLYGSDVPALIDRPGNAETIAKCYSAIVTAVDKWEPGYEVRQLQLLSGGSSGAFDFELDGIFYPLGHLGDRSVSESRSVIVQLRLVQ